MLKIIESQIINLFNSETQTGVCLLKDHLTFGGGIFSLNGKQYELYKMAVFAFQDAARLRAA